GIRECGLVFGQVGNRMAVPSSELIGGPRERLVQMAEVAGVRPTGRKLDGNPGTAHLMAADGLEHAVSRERHVTVVAQASRRAGLVPRVTGQLRLLAKAPMTLSAGPVVCPVARQLIVGIA